MDYQSTYHPELNLLIVEIRGLFVGEEMIAAKEREIAKGWPNPQLRTIVDLTQAEPPDSMAEVKAYIASMAARPTSQTGASTALLVKAPGWAALAYFFSQSMESVRRIDVFSTLQPSLDWLSLTRDEVCAVWPSIAARLAHEDTL